MARERKTVDGWEIQGHYGHGWECECFEWTRTDAKRRVQEYRENSPYPVRTIARRVRKADLSECQLREFADAVERERADRRKWMPRRYVITMKHDRGTVRLATRARTLTAAVRQILTAEQAPFSAIRKIEAGEQP